MDAYVIHLGSARKAQEVTIEAQLGPEWGQITLP